MNKLLTPLVLTALAGLSGCAPSPRLAPVADLVTEAPAARMQVETAHIDIGTAAGRRALRRGWWRDETSREDGRSFAWSRGDSSELELYLAWRRPLRLALEGRPFSFEGAPAQHVAVRLNGSSVADFEMAPGFATYELELPEAAQRAGTNTLELRYGFSRAPAEVVPGSRDTRRLAVAWDRLRLDGPGLDPADPALGIEVDDQGLTLPRAASAEYFLELPAEAVLACDELQESGDLRLSLELDEDQGDARELRVSPRAADDLRVPLHNRAGLVRLRLGVRPEHPGADGRVRLIRPRILAPVEGEAEVQEASIPHATAELEAGHRPNLVVYLIDALRADRLGCYGAARPLSPHIDAFAAEGIVFERTIAQSSWTKAAVASLFTGLGPSAHGANGPEDVLPSDIPLLSEELSEAGYQTAAVVANAYVNRPFGFARGFGSFRFLSAGEGASEEVNRWARHWLERRRTGPFFLFLHTIDPHAPYAAPAPFQERFAGEVSDPEHGQVDTVRGLVTGAVPASEELGRDLNALYDAEVAHADAGFGAFLDLLRGHGLYQDSAILLIADHGEAFGEHGTWTHGLDLHHEVIDVPMILRLPAGRRGGERIAAPVQQIDIRPTLLNLAGVQPSSETAGRNLLAPLPASRVAVSFLDYWGRRGVAATTGKWRYIEPLSDDFGLEPLLFDRLRDPTEQRNLAAERPVVAGYLAAQLRKALASRRAAETAELDAGTRAQLKALGYLD